MQEGIVIAVRRTSQHDILKDIQTRNGNFVAGGVLVSNCHHMSAETFHPCLSALRSRHKFGATATPYRTDKLDRIFLDHLGGISVVMADLSMIPTVYRHVLHTGVDLMGCETRTGEPFLPEIINRLVADDRYNGFLVDLAFSRARAGYRVLVISDRADHCVYLTEQLCLRGMDANFIVGSYTDADGKKKALSLKKREARYGHQIIVATPGCMMEGIDIPTLEVVQFVTPFSAKGRVHQGAGRALRKLMGKKNPIVDDIVQEDHKMLRYMGAKRLRYYRQFGWPVVTLRPTIAGAAPVPYENDPALYGL